MRRLVGRLAVLTVAAVAAGCEIAENPRAPAVERPPPPAAASLVNRAWISADSAAAPGSMRVFLEDGTLLMTSCVEVYRIARWEVAQDGGLNWTEDGRRIDASIIRQDPDSLVLELNLGTQRSRQNFTSTDTPFVCPDLRR